MIQRLRLSLHPAAEALAQNLHLQEPKLLQLEHSHWSPAKQRNCLRNMTGATLKKHILTTAIQNVSHCKSCNCDHFLDSPQEIFVLLWTLPALDITCSLIIILYDRVS